MIWLYQPSSSFFSDVKKLLFFILWSCGLISAAPLNSQVLPAYCRGDSVTTDWKSLNLRGKKGKWLWKMFLLVIYIYWTKNSTDSNFDFQLVFTDFQVLKTEKYIKKKKEQGKQIFWAPLNFFWVNHTLKLQEKKLEINVVFYLIQYKIWTIDPFLSDLKNWYIYSIW